MVRKAARGKEWKHLLKEPANTEYTKQMRRDWKKYGSQADDEFLVGKSKDLDSIIAEGGLTLIQFVPSWDSKADEWAKQYGTAADDLEGTARLVKVNALVDEDIMQRFGVTLTQRDVNPKPKYALLVDGKQLDETYEKDTDPVKLVEFVNRVANATVRKLATEADVEALLLEPCGSTRPCSSRYAIAIGSGAASDDYDAVVAAARNLAAVGEPVVTLAWIDATAADGALAYLQSSMAEKVDTGSGSALVLVAAESNAAETPPQIKNAVLVPAQGAWTAATVSTAAADWGYRAKGFAGEVGAERVYAAARLGVATAVVHLTQGAEHFLDKVSMATQTSLLGVRFVTSYVPSSPTASQSSAHDLATSHGLDGDTFPALSVVSGPPGAPRMFAFDQSNAAELTTDSALQFIQDTLAGKVSESVRSEAVPSRTFGPGSGKVDTLVALNVQASAQAAGVDVVLAIHDDDDARKFRSKTEKMAEKMAHVPSLSFGALNLAKNGVPASMVSALGDRKEWEGVWMFPADAAKPAERCKRKASLKELAKWIKGKAAIPFDAKAKDLPEGTYKDSCTGCRVEAQGEEPTKRLVCASCSGGGADAGLVSIDMSDCTAQKFANEEGALACDRAREMAEAVAADVAADGAAASGEQAADKVDDGAGGEQAAQGGEGSDAAEESKEEL